MYPDNTPEIQVEMFRWDQAKGKGVLTTIGLGPCIGVSIYDPVFQHGFLGHFPAQTLMMDDDFNKFLAAAKANISESNSPRVWIGGGEIGMFNEQDNEVTIDSRELILQKVSEKLADCLLTIEWLDEPGSIDYSLDVSTGEEIVETIFDADLDNWSNDIDE